MGQRQAEGAGVAQAAVGGDGDDGVAGAFALGDVERICNSSVLRGGGVAGLRAHLVLRAVAGLADRLPRHDDLVPAGRPPPRSRPAAPAGRSASSWRRRRGGRLRSRRRRRRRRRTAARRRRRAAGDDPGDGADDDPPVARLRSAARSGAGGAGRRAARDGDGVALVLVVGAAGCAAGPGQRCSVTARGRRRRRHRQRRHRQAELGLHLLQRRAELGGRRRAVSRVAWPSPRRGGRRATAARHAGGRGAGPRARSAAPGRPPTAWLPAGAANGRLPSSSVYSVAANEYTSERAVAGAPSSTSGGA